MHKQFWSLPLSLALVAGTVIAEKTVSAADPLSNQSCFIPGQDRQTHNPKYHKIRQVFDTLSKSSFFRGIIPNLKKDHVRFCDKEVSPEGTGLAQAVYDYPQRTVLLNTDTSVDELVRDTSHEVRHADQLARHPEFSRIAGNVPRLTGRYLIEADADAFSKTVLWDLKEQGIAGPWEWAKKEEGYKYVAEAYEQSMIADKGKPAEIAIRNAMHAGFDNWPKNGARYWYFTGLWDTEEKCILPSGPDQNLLKIADNPALPGEQSYLVPKDLDNLQNMVVADINGFRRQIIRREHLYPDSPEYKGLTCVPAPH